jgi:stearoyl-CoA desaturase (delta-9 desaturase)
MTLRLRWNSIIYFTILHTLGGWALYLAPGARWSTWAWLVVWIHLSCLGVTAGAHRLWAHKSYHAHPVLESLLLILQSSAVQMPVLSWCRTHRLHHRYTDGELDPHNINRGFWFAHMGWLLTKPTPPVQEALAQVNLDDLLRNAALVRQRRYFLYYALGYGIVLPWWCAWVSGESLLLSYLLLVVLRLLVVYHITWGINSVAHTFGTQPYSQVTQARQNTYLAFLSGGEGWHNYHHAYPGDYRANEGTWLNTTRWWIELAQRWGWARV